MTEEKTTGFSLKKLALKGTIWTIFGIGATSIIRLGGNLILTRLLFPEAFGLMALVSVFLLGLGMVSDVGIGQSIVSSKRGDDPEYCDTAWIVQILRGVFLTLCAWAIVGPYARFYNQPMLMELLPVAVLTLLIGGFSSTKIYTARKHLYVSKFVQLEIATQLFGLIAMIVLAWMYKSVWALVIGSLVSTISRVMLSHTFIPGTNNKFRYNAGASREILHFGKWIFLSTIAGFIINQGDKILLGKLIDAEMLGIYSIAFGLGSLPKMVSERLSQQVLFPLYAKRNAATDIVFRENVFKMRSVLTLMFIFGSLILAQAGPTIIEFLYDERYYKAGLILSAIALAFVPNLIVGSGAAGSLAQGDSKRYSSVVVAYAIIQLILMLFGGYLFGIWGVIGAIPAATVVSYPINVWATRKYGLWMPVHDGIAFVIYVLFSYVTYSYMH